ncbi:hypothetical protein SKP52_03090 [Sphingopyxis fribergensis]|uniref:Uncharacterized protein n=1 Tax=Sphingopyxis fribergensis TaxID=1515612 RepID=A0A0A7PHX0_9SPHN|nr:hypothetical protein [Sphingopyxis fribergensis]AJA07547.1 hypothetical protein SKP52_03090 [Sphingopyxis fribergensis]
MGTWIERQYNWIGLANRDEYRRWLPLILAVDAFVLWLQFEFGTDLHIDFGQFGWVGVPLFFAFIVYYAGWFFLTARRLRSADISRAWLLFALFRINLPVGDYSVNFTFIAALLLTAVGALAPDHDPYSAA